MKNTTQLKPEERQRCEVWTRVMGYHRPVAQFNAGKQSEHRERTHFVERVTRNRWERRPAANGLGAKPFRGGEVP
ncbi:hypothetical protein GCM10011348_03950 [Marinobacterium nitratireducens]|uniref:Oxidoreductase n=1 Tax=Marinobacterium nitratireducens TaxID=518897 RepID=A0A917Z7Y4_9GAMM|nr:hypothetical protein GCM10011348_03950 [Marinobacterium nitratireducens]